MQNFLKKILGSGESAKKVQALSSRFPVLFLLFISFFAFPAFASAGINDGLLDYYTFDGKDINWNTNRITDRGTQAFSGTIINFSTSTVPVTGKIGQGFRSLGNSSAYVNLNTTRLIPITGAYSYSLWVKTSVLNTTQYIFLSGAAVCCGAEAQFLIEYNSGGGTYKFYPVHGNGNLNNLRSNTSIQRDRWYHIVVTWDGSTTMKIYIDGALDNTGTGSGPANFSGSSPVSYLLGDGGSTVLNGVIDDLRFYNRALSATEVAELYKFGQPKKAVSPTQSAGLGLNSGLVGYWTMDGKDTNWSTNKTNDLSGNVNTGTMVNMGTTSAPSVGKVGQAFNFDGSNDYVNVGSASSLRITGAISISFWAKTTSASDATILGSRGAPAGGYTFGITTGKCRFTYFTVTDWDSASSCLLSDGKWHHYEAVNDLSTVKFYRDGQLFSTSVSAGNSGTASNTFVTIGALNDQTGCACVFNFFNGYIDDVRIYNRALSATEGAELYKLGQAKKGVSMPQQSGSTLKDGIVGYWTFDGKDTSWATNITQNTISSSNSGTMISMPTSTSVVTGAVGQGLKFDGSSSKISIGNLSDTGSYSVSAWAKSNASSNTGFIFMKGCDSASTCGAAAGEGWGFAIGQSSTNWNTQVVTTNGGTIQTNATGGTVAVGKWAHITGVYDNSAKTLSLYVNGALVAGPTGTTRDTLRTAPKSYIGAYLNGSSFSQYFSGSIDDVRAYNRALSATEVMQLYKAGTVTKKSI